MEAPKIAVTQDETERAENEEFITGKQRTIETEDSGRVSRKRSAPNRKQARPNTSGQGFPAIHEDRVLSNGPTERLPSQPMEICERLKEDSGRSPDPSRFTEN